MSLPFHVSEPGLAGLRHGPEPPDLLAGLLIVRGDEAVGAVLAAGHAGDHEVARGQRRRRRRVVLAPVGQRRVPQQLAGEAVQRDEVRVVGHHEHAIAGDRDAAVGVPAGEAPSCAAADSARSAGRCRRRARSTRSGSVTYMMPSTTTGVTCRLPAPGIVNTHAARAARRCSC